MVIDNFSHLFHIFDLCVSCYIQKVEGDEDLDAVDFRQIFVVVIEEEGEDDYKDEKGSICGHNHVY